MEKNETPDITQTTAKPTRSSTDGSLRWPDKPEFRPNLSPKEIFQLGSFGGTYYRPIYSSIVKKKLRNQWKEFPEDWFEGLDIKRQVTSDVYRVQENNFKAKTGQTLEVWESKGWITQYDPYGWVQWYCRFFLGRRTPDDDRQVRRWSAIAGEKGRWRRNLIHKLVKAGKTFDNTSVSPAVRQLLQHWGYALTEEHFEEYAMQVRSGKTTSFIPSELEASNSLQQQAEEDTKRRAKQADEREARRKRRRQ